VNRRLDDATAHAAHERRMEGTATTAELAAELGIDDSVLRRRWRLLGVGMGPRQREVPDDVARVAHERQRLEATSTEALAAELGVCPSTLRRSWRLLGLGSGRVTRPLTAAEVKHAAIRIDTGATLTNVAAELGRSPQQLSTQVRRRLGVEVLPKPARLTERNRRVFELLLRGATWWDVFEDLGVSLEETTPGKVRTTLWQGLRTYCRRAGLPMPTAAAASAGRLGNAGGQSCRRPAGPSPTSGDTRH
jgi:transposase-like protein